MTSSYKCDYCGKIYNTESAAHECEAKCVEAQTAQKKANEKRVMREEHILKAIDSFKEDYGTYPKGVCRVLSYTKTDKDFDYLRDFFHNLMW